jgi:hypothetical protein
MKPEKPSAETGRSAVRIRPQGPFNKMKKEYFAYLEYEDEEYVSVVVAKQEGDTLNRYSQLLLGKEHERITSFKQSIPIPPTKVRTISDKEVKELFESLRNNPEERKDVSDLVSRLGL